MSPLIGSVVDLLGGVDPRHHLLHLVLVWCRLLHLLLLAGDLALHHGDLLTQRCHLHSQFSKLLLHILDLLLRLINEFVEMLYSGLHFPHFLFHFRDGGLHPLELFGADLVLGGGLLSHLASHFPASSTHGAAGLDQLTLQGDHSEPLGSVRGLSGHLHVVSHECVLEELVKSRLESLLCHCDQVKQPWNVHGRGNLLHSLGEPVGLIQGKKVGSADVIPLEELDALCAGVHVLHQDGVQTTTGRADGAVVPLVNTTEISEAADDAGNVSVQLLLHESVVHLAVRLGGLLCAFLLSVVHPHGLQLGFVLLHSLPDLLELDLSISEFLFLGWDGLLQLGQPRGLLLDAVFGCLDASEQVLQSVLLLHLGGGVDGVLASGELKLRGGLVHILLEIHQLRLVLSLLVLVDLSVLPESCHGGLVLVLLLLHLVFKLLSQLDTLLDLLCVLFRQIFQFLFLILLKFNLSFYLLPPGICALHIFPESRVLQLQLFELVLESVDLCLHLFKTFSLLQNFSFLLLSPGSDFFQFLGQFTD